MASSSSPGRLQHLNLGAAKAIFESLDKIKLDKLQQYQAYLEAAKDQLSASSASVNTEQKIDFTELANNINRCLEAYKTLGRSKTDEYDPAIFHSLPTTNLSPYLTELLTKLNHLVNCFDKKDPNKELAQSLLDKIDFYARNRAIEHMSKAITAISALPQSLLMSLEAAYRNSKKYAQTIRHCMGNVDLTRNLNEARSQYDLAFNLIIPPGIYFGGEVVAKRIDQILKDINISPRIVNVILSKIDYLNSVYYEMHVGKETQASAIEANNLVALQTALMAIDHQHRNLTPALRNLFF